MAWARRASSEPARASMVRNSAATDRRGRGLPFGETSAGDGFAQPSHGWLPLDGTDGMRASA
jgi:hypothetical protein